MAKNKCDMKDCEHYSIKNDGTKGCFCSRNTNFSIDAMMVGDYPDQYKPNNKEVK